MRDLSSDAIKRLTRQRNVAKKGRIGDCCHRSSSLSLLERRNVAHTRHRQGDVTHGRDSHCVMLCGAEGDTESGAQAILGHRVDEDSVTSFPR
jgi:hypothetical protein